MQLIYISLHTWDGRRTVPSIRISSLQQRCCPPHSSIIRSVCPFSQVKERIQALTPCSYIPPPPTPSTSGVSSCLLFLLLHHTGSSKAPRYQGPRRAPHSLPASPVEHIACMLAKLAEKRGFIYIQITIPDVWCRHCPPLNLYPR